MAPSTLSLSGSGVNSNNGCMEWPKALIKNLQDMADWLACHRMLRSFIENLQGMGLALAGIVIAFLCMAFFAGVLTYIVKFVL